MNMADPPRTVLISGCSSGIGLQLAVQLAHDPRQRYQGKGPRAGLRGAGWAWLPGPSATLALFLPALPFQVYLWTWGGPRTSRGPFPPLLVRESSPQPLSIS